MSKMVKGKTLVGYTVGQYTDNDLSGIGYPKKVSEISVGVYVFKSIEDARIVMAADKLKYGAYNPRLEILEVHRIP